MHYLGTDDLGRDVFAGMFRGFYIAFKVGLITLFFSLIIGLFLGITMGYFGDHTIKLNGIQIALILLGCSFWLFYIIFPITTFSSLSKYAFPFFILGFSLLISKYATNLKLPKITIPYDFIIFRTMEIIKAVPVLVILLAVLPIFTTRGVSNIIIILVFVGWRGFARYSRSEVLSIKQEAYVSSAKSQGMGDWSVMFKEILPNILPTIYVLASFAFASIIVIESTLSFLGIGLPLDEVSWGSLLAQGRTNIQAWWLTIFPGLAIFSIVIALNSIMDKKLALDE
jgi:peptide/nickel transport system permease protein